ncbi:MAG: hypothetical protein QX198_08075 [Methylococcaceae bacterium]
MFDQLRVQINTTGYTNSEKNAEQYLQMEYCVHHEVPAQQRVIWTFLHWVTPDKLIPRASH